MNPRLERLLGRTRGARRGRLLAALAVVLLVPLAVAGVVSGALGGAGTSDRIPAIVVNDDVMQTTTGPDGAETPVLAGRLLVTALTGAEGAEAAGFDWTVSNGEQAAAALAAGSAYAVLTIPADFSASVLTMSGTDPVRAGLDIRTDDAHGYLAGSVVQSVGAAMTAAFGQQLTETYLQGLFANLVGLGGSIGDAADGAAQLSDGVAELSGGLDELAAGAAQSAAGAQDAADGAGAYAAGVAAYTDGVGGLADGLAGYAPGVVRYTDGVDGIADGLRRLDAGVNDPATGGLDAISAGVEQYTGTIGDGLGQVLETAGPSVDAFLAWAADPANAALLEQYPVLQDAVDGVRETQTGLEQLVAGGDRLAEQTRSTLDSVQDAVAGLRGGLDEISAGSPGLRDGANGLAAGAGALAAERATLTGGADGLASGLGTLADGLGTLSAGTAGAADGADRLEGGAAALADGLADGAEQASALSGLDADRSAEVVAQPVSLDAQREHEIGSLGEVIGVLFVPVGLWLGALALVLVTRPVARAALASTASSGRIAGRAALRTALVAIAQAIVVVALLHTAMGVPWSRIGLTLPFAMLAAAAFTAIHVFLATALGRIGAVVSLLLVTVQLTAAGGLVPIELVARPLQTISPLLPLTWGVQGMQSIVSGGGSLLGPVLALVVFALLALIGTRLAVARQRGIRSLSAVPAPA